MIDMPAAYMERIRDEYPALEIRHSRRDPDALANDVFVVNEEWVFRFPKTGEGRERLRREAGVLEVVRRHIDVSVPHVEKHMDDFTVHRFLAGRPLYNHELLRLGSAAQDRLAEQLAEFLVQLHGIPEAELKQAGLWTAAPEDRTARYLNLWEEIRAEVYPHLWKDQKAWVEQLFRPLLDGTLTMNDCQPVLTHNDLASYHILYQPEPPGLSAVLDFGEAGPGDAADDFALLISTYGESFLERMGRFDPRIGDTIDRARFMAGAIELIWALDGVRRNSLDWLLVHLGRSRDVKPIGVKFPTTG
jgi:aminoglycoside 2''-phosphotransferase